MKTYMPWGRSRGEGLQTTTRIVLWAVLIAITAWFVLPDLLRSGPRPEVKECEAISKQLRVFPGFTAVNQNYIAKSDGTVVGMNYLSDAPFADVLDFYSRELTSEGWTVGRQEQFSEWGVDYGGREQWFSRGPYRVTLTYMGEGRAKDPQFRSSPGAYTYSVNVLWSRWN